MKATLCASIIFALILSYQPKCHAQRDKNNPTNISNEFSWKLFRYTIVETQNDENFVLSPLTVQLMLAVLQYAAEYSTKEQILKVTNNVNPLGIYNILNPGGQTNEIKYASGFFVDNNEKVKKSITNQIYENGGDVFSYPLQKNPIVSKRAINEWASNATEGHIQEFLSPDEDISRARAFMASAVYFHSLWKHKIRPSQPRPFYLTSGRQMTTDYMEVTSYFKAKNIDLGMYGSGTVINLPYKESRYSMFFIVPNRDSSLKSFLAKINYRIFTEYINNSEQMPLTRMKLFIPKFKVSSKVSLVSPLKKMGLLDVFSKSQSQLTKLLEGNEPLFIDEIMQQSTLEVDEFGTTATSVTSISIVPLSAAEPEPLEFVIDVPFFAVIVDTVNEVPIFIARIANPQSRAFV